MKGNFVHANNDCIYVHMIRFCGFDIEYAYGMERVLKTYFWKPTALQNVINCMNILTAYSEDPYCQMYLS